MNNFVLLVQIEVLLNHLLLAQASQLFGDVSTHEWTTLTEGQHDYINKINAEVFQPTKNESTIFAKFGYMHTLEDLSYWARKEEEIIEAVNKRLGIIEEEIDLISRYIKDYEESSEEAIAQATVPTETAEDRGKIIGSSAVLAHLMTDRYATIVDRLRKFRASPEYENTEVEYFRALEVEHFDESREWPDSEDLFISHFSILQIQETLFYKPEEIYQGATVNTTHGGSLKPIHCVRQGLHSLERGHFVEAIEWLEFSLELMFSSEDDEENDISIELVKLWLDVVIQHNNFLLQSDGLDYNTFAKCFAYPTYLGEPRENRIDAKLLYYKEFAKTYMGYSNSEQNMLALCNNDEFQPIEVRSKMKCYMHHGSHPYLIINPLKAEQLSESPFIVQYYDVMRESFIQDLKNNRKQYALSTVATYDDSEPMREQIVHRSSAGALFTREYEDKVRNLTSLFTGLVGMEEPQMAEYVYGRAYFQHLDTFSHNLTEMNEIEWRGLQLEGDRVATVLYYIDEPISGGYTPFCEVGLAVKPVRGSAVFWLNMFKNGTVRKDVTHGSCPVLHSHKTVINQWIRYYQNMHTFKCSLNQFE